MSKEKKPSKVTKKVSSALKYSGLAFQLAALIVVAIWSGQWLDAKLGLEQPYITILLTLLLFTGFMYKLYKDLIDDNK